uniref:Uncharacterized protein n=1 Tax=Physcomitrium patens TaxID=3218 RepID=A0A7I4FEG0_PHYPA
MGTLWVATFESTLVSGLPGCVIPGSDSQHRIKVSNWAPPLALKSRRVFVSAQPSSSQGEESSSVDKVSDSSNQDTYYSSSEAIISAAGSGSGTKDLDSLLPSRKQGNEVDPKPQGSSAQSALERAMAYKKMKGQGASSKSSPAPQTKPSSPPMPPSGPIRVEVLTGKPIQSSRSSSGLDLELTRSLNFDSASSSIGSGSASPQGGEQSEVVVSSSVPKSENNQMEGSLAAQLSFEKAKAYKLQQSEMIAALNEKKPEPAAPPPIVEDEDKDKNVVEVEIYTRDGIVKRRVLKPETAFANVKNYKAKGVSTMDFVGLGFADKKSTNRPAGLSESFEAPSGPLPEVEMLTRDAGVADPEATADSENAYKPRVATWGMFPRPADISKANMKQGQNLMDRGRLGEAQAAFLSVMEEMPFPSELHGMAALQEAVCLDSSNRSDEAKVKYEKLVSHPNGAVRKKARQLLFGFQAAVKLKVKSRYDWDSSTYRKYFDAFADGYNTMYKNTEEPATFEETLMQTVPYALLLIFPIVLIFTLAVLKNV